MAGATSEPRIPWPELRSAYASRAGAGLEGWIDPAEPHFEMQRAHALSRLEDGISLLAHCESHEPPLPARPVDVLDLGSGNGGVALAFANLARYRVHALDVIPNSVLRALNQSTGLGLRHTIGSGTALPYAAESFDIVLLIDAIEHIPQPRMLGAEIMRVLRPGGFCIVSTVARLRFIFKKDPHWGIRGLVALPNWLQRFVVNRIARRRTLGPGGLTAPAYDVDHIYWHRDEIGRLFPGASSVTAMYSWPIDPNAKPFTREWREWLRFQLRGFVFNHVEVTKANPN